MKKKLFVQFFGEFTAGQSAYSFITPLVSHFWQAELALWDEPNIELKDFHDKVNRF